MNGHRHSVLAGWCLRWILGCALVVGLGVPVALAGPGMPDPKQMSGIPRPDAQIEAGQVTVRVLDGSFDKPV
ncbi:MAG: hypothetical protein K0V04_11145, partial [Deltaproteobacteria bacterium]|nr:hypothetical protein [Deltaproteobacteria bacterium]